MTDSFQLAMSHTLGWEKGKSNHPNDPGGLTFRGITQATLDDTRRLFPEWNLPSRVTDLNDAQIERIYRVRYFDACHCGELPPAFAVAVFDAAVNTDASKVRRWLQKSLRVTPDGWLGPKTIDAAKRAGLVELSEFHALRAYHYMLQDSIDDDFGLGWSRRLIDTHNVSREYLATEARGK
jgi:lysozyme family protein